MHARVSCRCVWYSSPSTVPLLLAAPSTLRRVASSLAPRRCCWTRRQQHPIVRPGNADSGCAGADLALQLQEVLLRVCAYLHRCTSGHLPTHSTINAARRTRATCGRTICARRFQSVPTRSRPLRNRSCSDFFQCPVHVVRPLVRVPGECTHQHEVWRACAQPRLCAPSESLPEEAKSDSSSSSSRTMVVGAVSISAAAAAAARTASSSDMASLRT